MKTQPTYYQKEIADRSVYMPYAALFLEQGLGKSKIEIDTTCQLYSEGKLDGLLVVSNKAVAENWYINEIPKHMWEGIPYIARLWGRNTKSESELIGLRNTRNVLRIFCINVEALRSGKVQALVSRLLTSGRFKMVVDESTIIKNPSAAQSRRCLSLSKLAAFTRILSGEPAPNGPMDLYHQYKFLSPHALPGFTKDQFMQAFVQTSDRWIGSRSFTQAGKEFTPHGQKLFEQMIGHCTFRLKKADVNDTVKFPAIERHVRKIQMSEEQHALYQKVLHNVQTELRDILGVEGKITATVVIAKLIKLHQLTSGFVVDEDGTTHQLETSPKLNALCQMLSEDAEVRGSVKPVLIWCHYRNDVDMVTTALTRLFPGQVARIYGGIGDNERITILERFTKREVPILVANPQSIGHGLTLTAADTAIYFSNHYNYEYRVQSRDRIHRLGQTADTVHYVDLVMTETVDEEIMQALERKEGFCKSLFLSEYIQRVLEMPTPVMIEGEIPDDMEVTA